MCRAESPLPLAGLVGAQALRASAAAAGLAGSWAGPAQREGLGEAGLRLPARGGQAGVDEPCPDGGRSRFHRVFDCRPSGVT